MKQWLYHKVTRIEEGGVRFGFQNQQERGQLTNRDCDQTAYYKEPVSMACYPQLSPDSDMLSEYRVCIRFTPFKELVQSFKPQYLKLAGKPENHTRQQEQPRSVDPGKQHQNKHHPVQEGPTWHRNFHPGKEDYFVNNFHDEGG